jgi:hypothetical protein
MTTIEQATQTGEQTGRELDQAELITWARLRAVQQQITNLQAEEDTLKGQLREHLGRGEFLVGGRKALTISPTRRFDQTRALAVLTADEVERCTVPVLDRKLVEQTVAPDRYRACQAEGGKLVVRSA